MGSNRKFKLTVATIIISCVFVFIAGIVVYNASTYIAEGKDRVQALSSFITSLLTWWGYFIIGILGFYHGANVTQKWFTKGGGDNGLYGRREGETPFAGGDDRDYDSTDILYARERSKPKGNAAGGVSPTEGDIRFGHASSGSGKPGASAPKSGRTVNVDKSLQFTPTPSNKIK